MSDRRALLMRVAATMRQLSAPAGAGPRQGRAGSQSLGDGPFADSLARNRASPSWSAVLRSAERRRPNATDEEWLEHGDLVEVLVQLERRVGDCARRLARVDQPPVGAEEPDERQVLRRRAHAAVLRSQLERVRLAMALARSCTELRQEQLERLGDTTEKPTTTMEVF